MEPITSSGMDKILDYSIKQADKYIRQEGAVHSVIYGFTDLPMPAISIIGNNPQSNEVLRSDEGPTPTYLVPIPFNQHERAIREIFIEHSIQAAVMMGEYWTFPTTEDGQEFLAGRGPTPSQHPNRQEGVFAAAFWPLGGYAHMVSRHIRRTPTSNYTRPWHNVQDEFTDTMTSMLSSWLEEALPQRSKY